MSAVEHKKSFYNLLFNIVNTIQHVHLTISTSTYFNIYFQDRPLLPVYPVDGKGQQQSIFYETQYSVVLRKAVDS